MKKFVEGDKSKAFCYSCSDIVQTTFLLRNFSFSGGRCIAKNVLVGVCDHCKETVTIPAQAVPAIAQSRASAAPTGSAWKQTIDGDAHE